MWANSSIESVSSAYHVCVLAEELISLLKPEVEANIVDATIRSRQRIGVSRAKLTADSNGPSTAADSSAVGDRTAPRHRNLIPNRSPKSLKRAKLPGSVKPVRSRRPTMKQHFEKSAFRGNIGQVDWGSRGRRFESFRPDIL